MLSCHVVLSPFRVSLVFLVKQIMLHFGRDRFYSRPGSRFE